jgi:hypothetical protein
MQHKYDTNWLEDLCGFTHRIDAGVAGAAAPPQERGRAEKVQTSATLLKLSVWHGASMIVTTRAARPSPAS